MVKVSGKTQVEVAELFNVDRSTISRLVSERRVLERKGAHLRFVKNFAGLLFFFMEERAACCGR